ncbi:MAG: DsrE family protein [Thermodesulfovibrionales bacterium]|nr:DsrE family protein [Thermodesulfovibrionales bacterium]
MGILTIGCFPGLIGSGVYDFALKLAKASVDKGHKVNLWFSGNATGSVKAKQKHLKDYSTAEKYITELLAKGVEICTCEACTVARGVNKPDAIEGVKWNAMHWYLAKVHSSDRVLQIGGE